MDAVFGGPPAGGDDGPIKAVRELLTRVSDAVAQTRWREWPEDVAADLTRAADGLTGVDDDLRAADARMRGPAG